MPLVEPADTTADVQPTHPLVVVVVSDAQPEEAVYRWEDDGGAVLLARGLWA
jgi:hypothetical protein